MNDNLSTAVTVNNDTVTLSGPGVPNQAMSRMDGDEWTVHLGPPAARDLCLLMGMTPDLAGLLEAFPELSLGAGTGHSGDGHYFRGDYQAGTVTLRTDGVDQRGFTTSAPSPGVVCLHLPGSQWPAMVQQGLDRREGAPKVVHPTWTAETMASAQALASGQEP